MLPHRVTPPPRKKAAAAIGTLRSVGILTEPLWLLDAANRDGFPARAISARAAGAVHEGRVTRGRRRVVAMVTAAAAACVVQRPTSNYLGLLSGMYGMI